MNKSEIEQLAYEVNMWGEDLLALNMKGGVPVTKAAKVLLEQQEEIEYWKEKFDKALALNDQIKYLEAQVYGGTTK